MSRVILLDVADIVLNLHVHLSELSEKSTITLDGKNIVKPNVKLALDIVKNIIEFIVDSKSAIPIKNVENDLSLEAKIYCRLFNVNFNDLPKKAVKQLTEFTDLEIILPIIEHLTSQVNQYVTNRNYRTWQVVTIGRNIILTEGEDYRIKEYYRLTGTAEEQTEFKLDFGSIVRHIKNNIVHAPGESDVLTFHVLNTIANFIVGEYHNVTLDRLCLLSKIKDNGLDNVTLPEALTAEVKRIIETYNMFSLHKYLDKTRRYTLEVNNEIFTFVTDSENDIKDTEELELVNLVYSLLNGDYLPPEERVKAEQYYQTNIEHFL